MPRPALPEKLYFRIGEVSALVGVAPHVLRYWETEFPGVKPDKSPSGQRVYARQDVLRLLEIHRLVRELGYTFDGARRALQLADEGALDVPAPDALGATPASSSVEPPPPPPAPPEASAAPAEASGETEALRRVAALRAGLLRARMGLSRALDTLASGGNHGLPTGAGERSSGA